MKKILSLIASLAMIFTLTLTGVNAEGANYTITAPNNGHTYEVYQIFTGDLANGVLSNVKWGANGTGTTGESVDPNILKELANVEANASDLKKLESITKYVNLTSPFHTLNANESISVAAGYYLIKDKDDSVHGTDSYTTFIVKVVGNVAISPKSDVPELEKKVKDINDTNSITTDWQDSSDYDIGDEISFQLKGTVAENYDDYKSYSFAFHDVEEAGFTFNADSVKVYVDGNEINDNYEVVTNTKDSCTFEVRFADLKDIDAVRAKSVITVEYTSTLNETATLGNQGNVNKAKLEFSNNPNDAMDTGETPWDQVIVFTYKVVVNKVDENSNALNGAGFTLYKKNGQGEYVAIGEELKGEEMTTFTWSGLDDGEYKLVETTTPAGYNTIADIIFTVNANHDVEWTTQGRSEVLNSLLIDNEEGSITFHSDMTAGSLTADVVNQSGTTLPETGGIGTTVFYVLGGVLVIASAVLFINKRKVKE